MEIVKGIEDDEIYQVIDMAYPAFEGVVDNDIYKQIIFSEANWDNSLKLVDDSGNIVGTYILGDSQLPTELSTDYVELNGIEGVLLFIKEEFRGQGWGEKLKDYPIMLEVDYIWGQQFKLLNNLDMWLKRRKLVADIGDVYFTVEKY